MSEVRFEPEPLLVLASRIRTVSSDLAHDTVEIQNIFSELRDCMPGAEIEEWIDDTEGNIEHCNQLEQTLRQLSDHLYHLHEAYVWAEEQLATQIANSFK